MKGYLLQGANIPPPYNQIHYWVDLKKKSRHFLKLSKKKRRGD